LQVGNKLRSAAEFEHARRSRDRLTDHLFIVQTAKNEAGQVRLGMAVGLRAAGNAVSRNRLRRLVRESFRLHRQELPPVDLLVTARTAAAKATNHEVFESLARIWHAIGTAR